ncbi:hypothetical protein RND81_05G132300 [Saponaria officinalis]|uniref:Glycosyltransferase n=1 Tax=Saponaria officinalis TaxID=3572 RepID=A0AAW1KYN9_SAPOF
MEANYEKPTRGAHVLLIPYPLQGHINPILKFAKRLVFKGLKVTILIPSSTPNQDSFKDNNNSSSIEFLRIVYGNDNPNDIDQDARFRRIKDAVSKSLTELLEHYKENYDKLRPTPKMVIYDSLVPSVLDVVKQCGIEGAPFFTQSCVVNSVYYHVHKGSLNAPPNGSDLGSLLVLKSLLEVGDLPSLVSCPSQYPPAFLRLLFDQVINWMQNICNVKTIGPCIPSKYLDNRIPNDTDYGLSLFEPETDSCIQWLNARQSGSVIYVSMGSMASLGDIEMEEMARALSKTNKYFLWVVRATEEDKLPLNFKQETSEKGLIVSWCPQLEVLAHPALGCFITHCGWNSTLEAISLGVPMVAYPQWTDQPTNAKCIMDLWKIGVKVRENDSGLVTREEIELCILDVMEGEKSKEIKSNAQKWKHLANETMQDNGSSSKNIEEFVAKLKS